MKKKSKKIIKIIAIVFVVLIGGVIVINVGREMIDKAKTNAEIKKNEEGRKNAKTLMEYVSYHNGDYYSCYDDDCYYMEFRAKDVKCDALTDDIMYLSYDILISNSGEIYDFSYDKLYSNNQNCKKKDTDIKAKAIKYNATTNGNNIMILTDDNKVYDEQLDPLDERFEYDTVKSVVYRDNNIKLLYDNMIMDTYEYNGWNNKDRYTVTVLKKDNKIYTQIYNGIRDYNKEKNTYTFVKEDLYKSLEEYGNIKELYVATAFNSMDTKKQYQFDDYTISAIVSDKGYYYLSEIKTDECVKYEDVKCELELKESEMYKKFSKDIKYIGKEITILSDNSVISTDYLTYPLDKDLK